MLRLDKIILVIYCIMLLLVSILLYPAFIYSILYMWDDDMLIGMFALTMCWFAVYLIWTDSSRF